jgi:anti-sigma B factor antagonist
MTDSSRPAPAVDSDGQLSLVTQFWAGDPSAVLLTLSGDLDYASEPLLSAELGAQLAHGHRLVVIDLTTLTFISSIGLSALIRANERARQSPVRFRIVADPTSPAARLLALTGLDAVLPVYDSAADAIGLPAPRRQ